MFILPQPKKLEKIEGSLSYSSFKVNCADADIKKMYCDFSDESAKGIIAITKNDKLKEEEYTPDINESGILIEYSEPSSAFRALSTLKKIFSQSENGAIEFV